MREAEFAVRPSASEEIIGCYPCPLRIQWEVMGLNCSKKM